MDIEQIITQRKRDDSLVIGSEETMKHSDELEQVIVAENIPDSLLQQIKERIGDTDITTYSGTNKELGSVCGKPFAVATVGIEQTAQTVR
jgi:large subunit ribosomal protein L30e